MAVIHMTCIKEVNRSASLAFATDTPFLATGTMAGVVDAHFSSSANLDIFKLDFTSVEHQLPLVGSELSFESFNRLSWGKYLTNSKEFSLGEQVSKQTSYSRYSVSLCVCMCLFVRDLFFNLKVYTLQLIPF
ncbi:unnamed protein product [Ilex paraguariensis]|uniref:Uncharacterized protein n=1 Tax=Ilex paraguariensis TaxID=185542 RepID=A0ABC8SYE1_9AQUA